MQKLNKMIRVSADVHKKIRIMAVKQDNRINDVIEYLIQVAEKKR